MKKTLMVGAAAVAMFLALGAPARSADIVDEPAMTEWSGLYVGGHVGYAWANMDGCYDCDSGSELFADRLDLEGIVGGLHVGYNWQMDDFVFGLEADVTFTDLNDSEDAPDPAEEEEQTGDIDLLASVRGRLGIALDDAMIYVTGGIAIADASWEETGEDSGDAKFNDIGGVVGGGAEYALSENIRLRAEGLYYFFNDEESVEDFDGANDDEAVELEDVFVVRGGVSLYFN